MQKALSMIVRTLSPPSRAVLVLALVLAGTRADAAEIRWQTDLAAAEAISQQTGKPLLIHFTASWCHYCHKMSKTTYTDENVAAVVQQQFVPVKLDVDENSKLVNALRITGFPTAAIVSSDFKTVRKISGFHPAEDFQKRLAATLEALGITQVAAVDRDAEVAAPVSPQPAFGGRCLVSLIDDRELRDGDAAHEMIYRDRRLHFASEKHKQKFAANPSHYWPAFDGNCPVAKVEQSAEQPGNPRFGVFYQGKSWFFASAQNQAVFLKSPQRYAGARRASVAELPDDTVEQ